MTHHSNFSVPLHISITHFSDRLPFLSPLSLSLSPLMDGQIMYIQSSSAPDAVRGCDKSPGGGTEWSGAEERGDEEDTTSGEHAEEKECSRERGCVKCLHSALSMCVCLCVESKHTPFALPSALLWGSLVDSHISMAFALAHTPPNNNDEGWTKIRDSTDILNASHSRGEPLFHGYRMDHTVLREATVLMAVDIHS